MWCRQRKAVAGHARQDSNGPSTETMISNRGIPPETLDHIVDQILDDSFRRRDALRQCCLVSRSWVPRTRRHLFADLIFEISRDLKKWKKTFPDPSTSPAHHARTLTVYCPYAVTAEDAEEGGWIRGFYKLINLNLSNLNNPFDSPDTEVSFAPFRNISPNLKTLNVFSPFILCSRVFDIIPSFPLLEDLTLANSCYITYGDSDPESAAPPSTSPVFTGFLHLSLPGGIAATTRQLLNLPNGLHFRKLKLRWSKG